MADPPENAATGEHVGRRTFSTAFRGFDQGEVRAYLELVAVEFARLRDRVAELETQLADAAPSEAPRLDRASLVSAVGEETARVLLVAQEAADELRTRAEEGAARALSEAHEEAARLRGAAESVLAERTLEAEEYATRIRVTAEDDAAKLRHDAAAEAEATITGAVVQGKDMVAQAQAARERVLNDLARRRKSALTQLEQLRAGRERLLSSFAGARDGVDRLLEEMEAADQEAKRAAEAIGRKPKPPEPAAEPSAEEPPIAEAVAEPVAAEPPAAETVVEPSAEEPPAAEHVLEPSAEEPPAAETVLEPSAEEPPAAETVAEPSSEEAEALAVVAEEPVAEEPVAEEPVAEGAVEPSAEEPPAPAESAEADPVAVVESVAVVKPPPPLPPFHIAAVHAGDVVDLTTPESSPDGASEDPPAPSAEVEAESDPEPASEPQAEPAPAPEPDAEPQPALASVGARTPYAHDPVPVATLPDEVVVGAPGASKVDRLFARIRADRATAVVEARAVLTPEPQAEVAVAVALEAEPSGEDPGLEAPRSDADESYLQQRDALVEKAHSSTVRAMRRALSDDSNTTLERLRTIRADEIGVDSLLGTEDAQAAVWAGRARAGLVAAWTAGTQLVAGEAAADEDLLRPVAERLAGELVPPLRQRIGHVLDAVGGDRGADTVDRVNGVFREWRARIDRAVGDALTEAVSLGLLAALPEGTAVRWVVEDVDGPCPDCDDNALAGATVVGEQFPTGQNAPPAHPGCRCVLGRATT